MVQPDFDRIEIPESPGDEVAQELFPIKMGYSQVYTQDWSYESPLNNDAYPREGDLDPKDVSVDAEWALLTREEVARSIASHPSGSAVVTPTAPVDSTTPVVVETQEVSNAGRTRVSQPTELPRLPSLKRP